MNQEFYKKFPESKINMEYLHPNKVYTSVFNEEVDLGIVSFPFSGKDLMVIPWRNEPFVLACYPEHPLAEKKSISIELLSGEKFIAFDRDLVIRKKIDACLKNHNVNVDVVFEFDNVETIKRAVEIGSGVSILPLPTLRREIESKTLKAISLSMNEFVRPLGIIHRKNKKMNRYIDEFIELLKKKTQDLDL